VIQFTPPLCVVLVSDIVIFSSRRQSRHCRCTGETEAGKGCASGTQKEGTGRKEEGGNGSPKVIEWIEDIGVILCGCSMSLGIRY